MDAAHSPNCVPLWGACRTRATVEPRPWVEGQLLRATYVAVMRYGPVNAIGLKLGLGRRLR